MQISFLGGVGEFGKNMAVYEQDGHLLVVDAGAMFPDTDLPGIDLVIPDFTFLEDNADRIAGLVLTHGHEDHIGAAPYLLERIPMGVWGAPITLGLLHRKMEETEAAPLATTVLEPGTTYQVGTFQLEAIPVTHSIPDAFSLVIKTPDASVLHTGDFKFDQSPLDGRLTHYHRFQEIGKEGVTAVLMDSTNVELEGMSGSESIAVNALEKYVAEQGGMLIVGLFSTNLMRIQSIYRLAEKYGKKVALFGRSVVANCRVAEDIGYLKVPPGVSIDVESISSYPKEKVILLVTGSQGEPTAALSRIAFGQVKQIAIEEGDLLLFSARIIPGNEKRIGRIINQIYRKGGEVITQRNDRIHVSGHGAQEEIKMMASWVRPKYYIPVHGEYRQLKGNAALASSMGISAERIILSENGQSLHFEKGELVAKSTVPVGSLLIDGDSRDPVDQVVVRDRRHLSTDGVVIPVVVINPQEGCLESSPEIISKGYPYLEGGDAPAKEATALVRAAIQSAVEAMSAEEIRDETTLKARVKASVKKTLKRNDQRIPLIIPVVMEI